MSYEDNACSPMKRYETQCTQADTPISSSVEELFRIAQDRGHEIERLENLILDAFESEDAYTQLKVEVVAQARRLRIRARSICERK